MGKWQRRPSSSLLPVHAVKGASRAAGVGVRTRDRRSDCVVFLTLDEMGNTAGQGSVWEGHLIGFVL